MERYLNIDGDSNVIAYEIGADYIKVQFATGAIYKYSYRSAGSTHVEQMKRLARSGDGLNSYIKRFANKLYE